MNWRMLKSSVAHPGIRRHGLTLVEVLVTIGVIGLLLSIVLPAVQHARETGRRAQCVSNLGQLGRALHGYEGVNRTLPPAEGRASVGPPFVSIWISPQANLLPYLEQSGLYYDIVAGPFSPGGALGPGPVPSEYPPLAVFMCPSDAGRNPRAPDNNYRVCLGPGPHFMETIWNPDGGPFAAGIRLTLGSIEDGLASTVAISEKVVGGRDSPHFDPRRDFWYSGASNLLGSQPPLNQMVTICEGLSGAPIEFSSVGGSTWYYAGFEHTWYNHAVPPNAAITECSVDSFMGGLRGVTTGGVFRATSEHPGGVNCAFLDGSVRFMTDNVDLRIWRALATRRGGEVMDLDP